MSILQAFIDGKTYIKQGKISDLQINTSYKYWSSSIYSKFLTSFLATMRSLHRKTEQEGQILQFLGWKTEL